MDQAVRSPKNQPTCWYCDRLGDTIIALSAPDDAIILTGDKQSFPALAAILKKPLVLVPSLKELRSARRARVLDFSPGFPDPDIAVEVEI